MYASTTSQYKNIYQEEEKNQIHYLLFFHAILEVMPIPANPKHPEITEITETLH